MDLLVISSYPQKGSIHGAGTVGVASYTKNTLLALNKKLKITVLAEKFNTDSSHYKENGIEVRRVWKRNDISLFWSLIREVLKEKKARQLMIAFEHAMFGSYFMLVFFPLFLLILKILKKDIYLVMHQVIDDINDLSGHIGLEYKSTKADLINIMIDIFYRTVFSLANKIIVFEEVFREKLSEFTDRRKITVIPHGVEKLDNPVTKEAARKKLGIKDEFVILYFGFIAWYKGTDWIVEQVVSGKLSDVSGKKIKLIIAGEANPNHKEKKFYMDYVNKVKDMAKLSNGQVVVSGFVEEKDIPLYFQACDLVVLPYRTMMSSSGPLSLAISYGKPFMVSENIGGIRKTGDFEEVLRESDLNIDDISFNLADDSFYGKLKKVDLLKLTKFSQALGEKRSFEIVAKRYLQEL